MITPLRLKLKQKWLPFLYGYLALLTTRLIGITCTFECIGLDSLFNAAQDKSCILMFWHNRIAMIAEILCRYAPQYTYAAFISQSRDGQVLATFSKRFRAGHIIRVPHNARSSALKTLIKEIRKNTVVILYTPDGPRGPLHTVKPGIVVAANTTRVSVVPLSWTATRYWELPTWDRLMIPKPFSKIVVKVGEILEAEDTDDKQALASQCRAFKDALCALD